MLSTKPHAEVIVDEAYFGFGSTSYMGWLKEFPNLSIMRSLSKSSLSPTLRVGFLVSNAERIKMLSSKMPQFLLTNFSLIAAKVSLISSEFFRYQAQTIAAIIEERQRLSKSLAELSKNRNFEILPSSGNFVTLSFPCEERLHECSERLLTHRIKAAQFLSDLHYPNMLRFSICAPQENDRFLEAFR